MSIHLKGIPVSPGIVIGECLVLDYTRRTIKVRTIKEHEIDAEMTRFNRAIDRSKEQINALRDKVAREIDDSHAAIFDSHLLILSDQLLVEETRKKIFDNKTNAEYAFNETVEKLVSLFSRIEDDYFSSRNTDIHDVANRVLNNLSENEEINLGELKDQVIVIAHDLGPSDTAHMNREKVIAFATEIGGPTSHTAIMAKALEIPAVVGLETIAMITFSEQTVIVDGVNGVVIVDPTPKEITEYTKKKQEFEIFAEKLSQLRHLPAVTLDGYSVTLCANIELPEEIAHLDIHGAQGIGLFRTEFLYLGSPQLPTEEEQFKVYRDAIKATRPHSVVFRTLDLGGDKFLSSIPVSDELNPFLGRRAIRLCLEFPDIFTLQIRAILRASAYGTAKIMFPLISCFDEVLKAKSVIEEVKNDLRTHDVSFDDNIQTGIMIEVPSAVMIADKLAREVDFFSIGTNDLIQYTLAVDRVNEKVAYLYDPMHPSIIRLIRLIVKAAHIAQVWVSVCGEMAGDPFSAVVLLGLGVDELSMGAVAIPEVKRAMRNIRLTDAKQLADEIMTKSTGQEVRETVTGTLSDLIRPLRI